MDISGIAALDVLIGLAFLYFLLSTACSAINEAIASWMNWRAKELLKGIGNLLGDLTDDFYKHDRVLALFKPNRFLENTPGFQWLFRLRRSPLPKDKKPSYIPPRIFALTALDTAFDYALETTEARANGARTQADAAKDEADEAGVRADAAMGTPDEAAARAKAKGLRTRADEATVEVRKIEARLEAANNPADVVARAALVVEAELPNKRVGGMIKDALAEASRKGVENPAESFQLTLERSFNDAMDRVSGWYKRRTQLMIFFIALAVVGGLNADSFAIGQRLFKDDALRASVVAQATKAVEEGTADCVNTIATSRVTETPVPAPTPGERAANCLGQVRQLGLPLGWSNETSPSWSWSGWTGILGKTAGLLVTVFALLLGAPFWFDLLGHLARLRGAGPKPAATTEPSPPTPVTVVVASTDRLRQLPR